MHRPSSPDYPGSETQAAWSDVEPSVLPLSLSGGVFAGAQELIFSTNRSEIFSAYAKACIVTGETLFPLIQKHQGVFSHHEFTFNFSRKDGCLVRPRFMMVRVAIMQRTERLCESGVTLV